MRKPSIDLPDQMPERRRTALVDGQRVGVEEIIRVPTIRGHLRFWWRALYGQNYDSPRALYAAEKRLWGGTTDGDDESGGRSLVEVTVSVDKQRAAAVDESQIQAYGTDATPGAYALWPARGADGQTPAPRRTPGQRFELKVCVPAVADDDGAVVIESQVRAAVHAWILFGGYGGRTRRGLGSLRVTSAEAAKWLPQPGEDLRAELARLFGRDVFTLPSPAPARTDLPQLIGAELLVAADPVDNHAAWICALGWLREFRQGDGTTAYDAREPDTGIGDPRPHVSRWPEADKLRHLAGMERTSAHKPAHNAAPVWPRAGFGLPIIGQWQTTDRFRRKRAYTEPQPYALKWQTAGRDPQMMDRLASPLIVKALPLANGQALPCALWLYRAYPNGTVRPEMGGMGSASPNAPFDQLVAAGDTARFAPLARRGTPTGHNLRDAFRDWLTTKRKAIVAIPGA